MSFYSFNKNRINYYAVSYLYPHNVAGMRSYYLHPMLKKFNIVAVTVAAFSLVIIFLSSFRSWLSLGLNNQEAEKQTKWNNSRNKVRCGLSCRTNYFINIYKTVNSAFKISIRCANLINIYSANDIGIVGTFMFTKSVYGLKNVLLNLYKKILLITHIDVSSFWF